MWSSQLSGISDLHGDGKIRLRTAVPSPFTVFMLFTLLHALLPLTTGERLQYSLPTDAFGSLVS